MLKVAICDDDDVFCSELENYVSRFSLENNIKIDIQTFYNAQDLLEDIDTDGGFDLLFLDIELGNETGVEVGKWIRSNEKIQAMQIVFVSAKESYAMQLFDIRPMNFLVKPINYERVKYILDEYGRLFDFQPCFFEYISGRRKHRIDERHIVFFQSQAKQILMVTLDGEQQFYGKLSEVYEQISSDFFCLVHKSYLINMRHVIGYNSDSVTMINGDSVPVSRSMRSNLSKKIIENG
ncbi:MAG: LytTR family DNA-binding domain-containing protein [Eubacteriales bacterium]|nr:LytTR family DNA-binding domain-containing protein [Eubacteriales bacterium]